jgi:hypothetical protein
MSFNIKDIKMRKLLLFLLPFLLQAEILPDSVSVDSSKVDIVKIVLKDGSVLIGEIISEDDTQLTIQTRSGIKSEVPKVEISKRSIVTDKIVEGQVWDSDPNATRLFFSPTGRPLNKGEGYFAIYELFFPFLAVGLTDNFTLAGGMSLFPGADDQLFYVAPKYAFLNTENTHVSAGVLYLRVPDVSEGAGIIYGVGTFGSNDKALTAGLGFGFAGDEFADKPLLTIGGEIRTGQHTKLISENWIFPGEGALISGGLRFFGEKMAGDFGFMVPTEGDVFIPWLGFVYNF